ncbi:hypothetical protein AB204_07355 [Xenorhabdus khoisanae]|uniref:Uncharacterized protein n=2 Tax=Xenorhabdus khoisanae TaxID=880157 RepID=A0A0J5FUX9_9GAMM|nr:hypothetical protein [Xenorhabdus khoisanae]KMJ45747.1 hypothetical protein AB204_07355 [Xenorhabdus khoisanae]
MPDRINSSCLIGYEFDKKSDRDGFSSVIIYWKTAQALWAKEGVMQLIDDCELHGQKITIKPSEVIKFK